MQQEHEFTDLIRKHIPGDLVGNNVRIICEDVVQNRAVILSWNKTKQRKKVREQQAEQQSPICCQGLNPLKKSTSTSCNPLLNYITSSPLTCFFGFLFLQPLLSQAFFFKVPLTQSKAIRKVWI